MTRFRAYATDSDEDTSSDESVHEERRLMEPPAPSAQPLVAQRSGSPHSDSDDSDMYTNPDPERRAEDSSESEGTPPPGPSRLADPSLIPWAREVGVDRQKMHVMQASLFRAPEEAAAIQDVAEQQASRRALPASTTILGRKHSRDSDGEGLRADSRQVRDILDLTTVFLILPS